MGTGKKQQADRNIQKHTNYLRFIKNHYESLRPTWIINRLIPTIKELIKFERKK